MGPAPTPQPTPPQTETTRKPRFLLQATLILLPALILAAVALAYLRQEKRFAARRTREEAAWIAARVAPELDSEFRTWSASRPSIGLRELQLATDRLPAPADTPGTPGTPETTADPRPADRFDEATALSRLGNPDKAAEIYADLLRNHPGARSRTGLPLKPLVLFRQFAALAPGQPDSLQVETASQLLRAAVETHPSPVTGPLLQRLHDLARERKLLDRIDFQTWSERWTRQQHFRDLADRHYHQIVERDRDWLAAHDGDYFIQWLSDQRFRLLPARDIAALAGSAFARAVPATGRREFFLRVTFFARPLPVPAPSPDTGKPLASSAAGPFVVAVALADPGLLDSRARRQVLVLGSLIAAALLCAILGAILTRRALLRQFELNRLQTNFVASVSHELRAPVASVRLLAERLEAQPPPEPRKHREYLSLIGRECRRLSGLVANVLDLSRIDTGRHAGPFEPADLQALVRETVDLARPLAGEKNLTLETRLAPLPADPEIDAIAVQRALANLLDNAIKFAPRDSTVTIGLEPAPDDSRIALAVTDRGPGIPPSEQSRVFERFYRVGSELNRETSGVGIGLAIVRHIVRAHHGEVRLASSPGKATTFTLVLPLSHPAPA